MTATLAVTGGMFESIALSLYEILPVYLADGLHLSVAVAYLVSFSRPQKINYTWKICHCELWNLANWPMEFVEICRRKLWCVIIM